jgi:hypothetical protein
MIKILMLKLGTILVASIEDIGSELGEPDCKLSNPFALTQNVDGKWNVLQPWPEFTSQRSVVIHSDSILTIVEPTKELIQKFQELTAE